MYPNSTPELRLLIKADGTQMLQVRYVNAPAGYTGPWHDIPIVIENENSLPSA